MRRSAYFDKADSTQETPPLVIQSAQREESAVRVPSPTGLGTKWLFALLLVAPSTTRLAAQNPIPSSPPTLITLDQAIDRALLNSPTLKATRTQIGQNKAQETTANPASQPRALLGRAIPASLPAGYFQLGLH